jgi:hypothetical protein
MQDATLRFYVLTSRNLKCLKRHFVSLPKQHTTVIINTLDKEYESLVQDWCFREKINCVATESNGKPGKGKNAVLDHFLDSDYDYMVQIDGDDFLQPHGVNLYTWVAHNDAPDGIQIVHSYSYAGGISERELFAPAPWDTSFRKWATMRADRFPHLKAMLLDAWDRRAVLQRDYNVHVRQNKAWNYPADSKHFMDCARLIFWSRKLAGAVRYDETLLIGEDTLLNFEVRDLAYRKSIDLRKVVDQEEITYTYDLTNSGIVKRMQNQINWEWLRPLNKAITAKEKQWAVGPKFTLKKITYDFEKTESIILGEL